MKLQIASLLSVLAFSDAGISYPTVDVNLKGLQGDAGPFEGLDPVASWSASTARLGCNFEAGATSSIKPTLDVLSLPRTVWGKVRTQAGQWKLSSKAVGALDGSNDVSFNVAADNDEWDTSLEVTSSGGSQSVQIVKGFDALGGRVSVNPRYNIQSSDADVILGYDASSTSVTVEASQNSQKLTVAKQITDSDRLTPSITSGGDFALAWRKSLDGGNAVTTTMKLNDSLSVKWEDGPWTAAIKTPLSGYKTDDVTVRIHRKLNFI